MVNEDGVKLDLSDISKELSFLLYLLRNNTHEEILIKQYASDLDWELFMKLALHHRVYPLVYQRLKGMNESLIPSKVMTSLQQHYHNNVMKMLHLSREMSQLCEALKDNGVRTLLLKGPILATQLYGDLAHRTSKDLDILVDVDDVERVERVLGQLGYELQDERILENWKKTSHHFSYEHKKHSTQIEVHWRLNPHYNKSFSFDLLWGRRNDVMLSHQIYHYLGNEDLLNYLADHGARHGWFRLRWLMDIARLLPMINGSDMKAHFERYGGQQYVGQAFILLSRLFSVDIPHDLTVLTMNSKAHRLAQSALYYIKRIVKLNPVPEKSVAWRYNRYLFSLMTRKQKVSYILNKFLPNSRDASVLPLPKSLHFLYYPLRPFLWFWRRMKQPSI